MNFKLIFQLSLFGLIMAFATVSLIPEKVEFFFWLVIFVFCAYMIARVCREKHFWHGFLVSIFNSVCITAVHFIFFDGYVAHHPDMAAMSNNMGYFGTHPRVMMLCMAIPFGAMFGLFQGLFAFVASKIVKPKQV